MLRLVIIISIICMAVAAYFFVAPEPQTVSSQTTDSQPIKDTAKAKSHINQLTQGSKEPIDIKKADNFVTADQLINLPEPSQSNQAELEEVTPEPVAESSTSGAEANTFAVTSHLNVIGSRKPSTSTDTVHKIAELTGNQIKLQELLDDPDESSTKVYFIHAVNDADVDGLWGIIQSGLTKTFTQGLDLPSLDETVYIDIPEEADEKLDDKRSSFLGRVLKNKVDKTYIYNYEKGILGDNPDLIKPGQQLIIVTFTEQELIGIYDHFVNL